MLILLLLFFLISNAVTLERDKSILFSCVVILGIILSSLIAFNNPFIMGLESGIIELYGGLFNITTFVHPCNIFFTISAIILALTAFYYKKLSCSFLSLYNALFDILRSGGYHSKLSFYSFFSKLSKAFFYFVILTLVLLLILYLIIKVVIFGCMLYFVTPIPTCIENTEIYTITSEKQTNIFKLLVISVVLFLLLLLFKRCVRHYLASSINIHLSELTFYIKQRARKFFQKFKDALQYSPASTTGYILIILLCTFYFYSNIFLCFTHYNTLFMFVAGCFNVFCGKITGISVIIVMITLFVIVVYINLDNSRIIWFQEKISSIFTYVLPLLLSIAIRQESLLQCEISGITYPWYFLICGVIAVFISLLTKFLSKKPITILTGIILPFSIGIIYPSCLCFFLNSEWGSSVKESFFTLLTYIGLDKILYESLLKSNKCGLSMLSPDSGNLREAIVNRNGITRTNVTTRSQRSVFTNLFGERAPNSLTLSPGASPFYHQLGAQLGRGQITDLNSTNQPGGSSVEHGRRLRSHTSRLVSSLPQASEHSVSNQVIAAPFSNSQQVVAVDQAGRQTRGRNSVVTYSNLSSSMSVDSTPGENTTVLATRSRSSSSSLSSLSTEVSQNGSMAIQSELLTMQAPDDEYYSDVGSDDIHVEAISHVSNLPHRPLYNLCSSSATLTVIQPLHYFKPHLRYGDKRAGSKTKIHFYHKAYHHLIYVRLKAGSTLANQFWFINKCRPFHEWQWKIKSRFNTNTNVVEYRILEKSWARWYSQRVILSKIDLVEVVSPQFNFSKENLIPIRFDNMGYTSSKYFVSIKSIFNIGENTYLDGVFINRYHGNIMYTQWLPRNRNAGVFFYIKVITPQFHNLGAQRGNIHLFVFDEQYAKRYKRPYFVRFYIDNSGYPENVNLDNYDHPARPLKFVRGDDVLQGLTPPDSNAVENAPPMPPIVSSAWEINREFAKLMDQVDDNDSKFEELAEKYDNLHIETFIRKTRLDRAEWYRETYRETIKGNSPRVRNPGIEMELAMSRVKLAKKEMELSIRKLDALAKTIKRDYPNVDIPRSLVRAQDWMHW